MCLIVQKSLHRPCLSCTCARSPASFMNHPQVLKSGPRYLACVLSNNISSTQFFTCTVHCALCTVHLKCAIKLYQLSMTFAFFKEKISFALISSTFTTFLHSIFSVALQICHIILHSIYSLYVDCVPIVNCLYAQAISHFFPSVTSVLSTHFTP